MTEVVPPSELHLDEDFEKLQNKEKAAAAFAAVSKKKWNITCKLLIETGFSGPTYFPAKTLIFGCHLIQPIVLGTIQLIFNEVRLT